MEQEGAGPEEGEAPSPREVEYVRVQRGPATCWVDLKDGAAGGGTAKYVAPLPGPLPGRGEGKAEVDVASETAG